jgi:hypothetical protein
MKTFQSPKDAPKVGEFTYEGCRYAGIEPGLTFSVLSDGLIDFLLERFPFLVEQKEVAPVAENKYCCSKCGKDCGSQYMKERHEKVCKEIPQNLAIILKPSYIFWNYKGLDKTQLTEDQLIPGMTLEPNQSSAPQVSAPEPASGKAGYAMIGKSMQPVTTDREGVDWYGEGLVDDVV